MTPEPAREASPFTSQDTVLVVEDSRMVAAYLRQALEGVLGLTVVVVTTYAEAEALLKTRGQEFFMALLDLNLPDAPDGEVVDLALSHSIPAVVLTAVVNREIRATIVAKGVVDFVLKSRDAARQIIDIIRRLERNRDVTLLVVDDSEFLRRAIRNMLILYGFTVLEADNGVSALETLEAHPEIRLVVTDYEMPGMDGFALCRKIREKHGREQLAVIGVSSFEDDLLSVAFIKNGANDFLAKPFQREELYWRIAQNLENLDHIDQINESLDTISRMNTRMKRDLEAAANLQKSLLPSELPQPEGYCLSSLFRPCDELAGDTFNAFWLDEGQLGIYVLDVSGHGVPAALLSVTLSRFLTPEATHSSILTARDNSAKGYSVRSPAEVCRRLNRQFPMDLETFQYFTIIYGILDCGLGTFTYATAGHCGPLHISAQGSCNALPTAHPAIGLSPETLYTQQSLDLAAGDTLYFYTDGIVEAQNPAKEEYSLERMQEVLGRARIQGKSDLDTALSALLGDVSRWNRNEYKDDVTILALARTE